MFYMVIDDKYDKIRYLLYKEPSMNIKLLDNHITSYLESLTKDEKLQKEIKSRIARINYYKKWTKEKTLKISEEELYEYMAKLWAMQIWGNKKYYVDKIIKDNGLDKIREQFAELIWGKNSVGERWDNFRKNIKGLGPAMISEILAHSHPEKFIIWNKHAYHALQYLGVENLPVYNYQVTGDVYSSLINTCEEIYKKFLDNPLSKHVVDELHEAKFLLIDYFFYDELQEKSSVLISDAPSVMRDEIIKGDNETISFIHNELRDKVAEIGDWLGFKTSTEVKVAEGSKVDAIWEVSIGNLGRIIYVFEVQAKGSVDSLIMNLMKSLNNPAVQVVVAISDSQQLEKIKRSVALLGDINKKLRYWDFLEVMEIHENLSNVSEKLNKLDLVPESF